MNQWYFYIGMLIILLLVIFGILISVILFIVSTVRKQHKKAIIISMITNYILLVVTILYVSSHSTYYKFNDWVILQSNIHLIKQTYGDFDLGEIKENQKDSVAYYIYTDNGPILPDHLKHYYYMEYDESGTIYNVYNACQPGG